MRLETIEEDGTVNSVVEQDQKEPEGISLSINAEEDAFVTFRTSVSVL